MQCTGKMQGVLNPCLRLTWTEIILKFSVNGQMVNDQRIYPSGTPVTYTIQVEVIRICDIWSAIQQQTLLNLIYNKVNYTHSL